MVERLEHVGGNHDSSAACVDQYAVSERRAPEPGWILELDDNTDVPTSSMVAPKLTPEYYHEAQARRCQCDRRRGQCLVFETSSSPGKILGARNVVAVRKRELA